MIVSNKMLKIHFLHVGHMSNKGTQGLFKTDVTYLKNMLTDDVSISVSTTDIEGVKKLNLTLDFVLPSLIDIPYERADSFAKKHKITRESYLYKLVALIFLLYMPIQAILSLISAYFIKLGLPGIYRNNVLKSMFYSDLIISSSDEIYKETSSLLPITIIWRITWWSMLFSKGWDVFISKIFNKPIIMFPNSVGPFKTRLGRSIALFALRRYELIIVREPISFDVVKSLELPSKLILTTDMAVLFAEGKESRDWVPRNEIGVCPGIYSRALSEDRELDYIITHARVLDKIIEKYGMRVKFVPHYISGFKNDDLDISKKIQENMKFKEHTELIITDSVDDFRSILLKFDLVISSKMHPAVFSTSGYVPTICVAYDHKQIGFFNILDMSEFVISLQNINYSIMLNKIEKMIDHLEDIQVKLYKKMINLKEKQRKAIKEVILQYLIIDGETNK